MLWFHRKFMNQPENETRALIFSKWCNIDFDRIRHSRSLFRYKLMASALILWDPMFGTNIVCHHYYNISIVHMYYGERKKGSVQNGKIIMIYIYHWWNHIHIHGFRITWTRALHSIISIYGSSSAIVTTEKYQRPQLRFWNCERATFFSSCKS